MEPLKIRLARVSNSSTSHKRRRAPDFSTEEIRVIVDAYSSKNCLLMARFSDGITSRMKQEAYEEIAQQVNSVGHQDRTVQSIKDKWQDLKKSTKMKLNKLSLLTPGSWDWKETQLTEIEEKVANILTIDSPNSKLLRNSNSSLSFPFQSNSVLSQISALDCNGNQIGSPTSRKHSQTSVLESQSDSGPLDLRIETRSSSEERDIEGNIEGHFFQEKNGFKRESPGRISDVSSPLPKKRRFTAAATTDRFDHELSDSSFKEQLLAIERQKLAEIQKCTGAVIGMCNTGAAFFYSRTILNTMQSNSINNYMMDKNQGFHSGNL